jgi:Tol biopolymer transport system component
MEAINVRGWLKSSSAGAWLSLWLALPAAAQVTILASVDSNGAQGGKDSFDPWISADGRYVGFMSYNDLGGTPGERFVHSDVYLRDRSSGTTERISVNSNEVTGNSFSYNASLSADVRYVSFLSFSTNLVPGDTNGPYPVGLDVFVRDRLSGTTQRMSVASNGAQANGESYAPSISADGRWVVFYSDATNLVAGDTNAAWDVFIHDRQAGATERVSVDSNGMQGSGASSLPSVSADGRFVAFASVAGDLVPGDTNAASDVFVRDRQSGTTERVSLDSSGAQGNDASSFPSISADGRFVAYYSSASNLAAGDTNGKRDIFVRDRQTATTERISLDSLGMEGDGDSSAPCISPDGRYVAFQSASTNLVPVDTNGYVDVFVRDRRNGTTQRVSLDSNGAQGIGASGIYGPTISSGGRFVAFDSHASFVAADTNSVHDVYVRDREYAPFTSLCDAGVGGVAACPCSNPPTSLGRGCDNSSGTGGATLSATGIAFLSADSLVLTAHDEKPTATSIVLQGNALVGAGIAFGQGVRCAGGTIERLYTKSAAGGSITAPDFGAGDPSVSARSAALGDTIQPGQSRWYLVYYRDPIVLGGCPSTSTFNATQTGEVAWQP